jgi:hypothetical protein
VVGIAPWVSANDPQSRCSCEAAKPRESLPHFDKMADELDAFWTELAVIDKQRWRDPTQWPDLWVEIWVHLFEMSYLLGHIVAVGLPVWGLYAICKPLAKRWRP